jgi:LPXTG-motif cell wall-anchored protein
VKRFRWGAVLIALVLALSWAGAAQAQTTSNQPANDDTTTVAGGDEGACTPAEAIASHSKISTDTESEHPSASASFTVNEGCRIAVFLVSIDENGQFVDSDPPLPESDTDPVPTFGAGEHTLKVDLPSCAHFFVTFDAFQVIPDKPLAIEQIGHAERAVAKAMASGEVPSEPDVAHLGDVEGDTTNCPEPPEKLCDPDEGLASHSQISTETASAHPSASASFTVKKGCRVVVFLVSLDENGDVVDADPPFESEDPTSGPGKHTLKVDLPSCAHFFVLFDAFKFPKDETPTPEQLQQAQQATAQAMTNGEAPPEPEVVPLDDAEGDTTNCPTPTTAAPATTLAPAHVSTLPQTGSNSTLPMLIAALALVAGGGVVLLAARSRGRRAHTK